MILIFSLFCISTAVVGISEKSVYKIVAELTDGTMKKFYAQGGSVLEQIKKSEESDVVVTLNGSVGSWVLKEILLSSDSTYWVDKDIARFYGKNTVRLVVS